MSLERTSRRRRLLWLAGGTAVIIIAVLVRGTMHRASAADQKKDSVQAAPVGALTALALDQKLPLYLTGIGTVQAALSVTVKARVDGQLLKVAYKEGQTVKEGDLLAQIDPDPYQAQLDAAAAQQAKDEANYANSLVDLQRYDDLMKQDSIAKQTYDTQVATVAQLKATVGVDRAQVANARVQLNYTAIRSPIAGVVGIRLVDPGNIVHAADTNGLVVVNQVDPISLIFTLPEDAFQRVSNAIRASGAKPLQVLAYGREDNALLGTGELLLINNQIDTTTGTVQLKASFPNPQHRLWPGQYVNVHVVTGIEQVVTIPAAAVQRGANGLYAYVVKPDGTAALQPIQVALEQDGLAVVQSGIAAGTRVVGDGQFRLRPGVKVVEQQGGAAPAPPPGGKPS